MRPVYIAPEIAGVEALHPYLRDPAFREAPIREQIERQAKTLLAAHEVGDMRAAVHIVSWWPGARGRPRQEVMEGPFDADDALGTMAREYGYAGWKEARALGDGRADLVFEQALDVMLDDEMEAFKAQLAATPSLATARSRYGHRATLLHYLGSNGVESHRQRVPSDAVAMARLLISHGADPRAEAGMYGGGQTAHALASTSAHPHNAGIVAELCAALAFDET